MSGRQHPAAEREPSTQVYKGTRPGGRSARVRAAVLAAAAEELLEHGYDGFSMPRVAERAGVALTTVHRRWGTKARLIADIFADATAVAVPEPQGDTLEEDLRTLAGDVAASLENPMFVTLLRSAFVLPDEELDALRQAFWVSRYAVANSVARRAIDRGELPEGTDGWAVVERVHAPIWMRLLITGLPVDGAFIDELVRDALVLARRET
ncbi:MAG: TetR/AcrR family transcriptional regulator [Baekduiaceae bacterium]